jgi:nitrite reductase/ring-hydroxylating ferredoxin subunit
MDEGDRAAVLPADALPPDERALVQAFGTDIALFNIGGRLFAVANTCPHYGGPLCRGRVTGARRADAPYEHRWESEKRVLVCPWHGWEFDLESGNALFDSAVKVRVFDASVEDGQIVLRRRRRNP